MMYTLAAWLRKNWLTALLITVILFLLGSGTNGRILKSATFNRSQSMPSGISMPAPALGSMDIAMDAIGQKGMIQPEQAVAPQAGIENRMVIQESNLSLLVENVTETRDQIVAFAQSNGGYMVNSNVNNPQDAPTATVVIRVKSDKIRETLEFLRGLSVKVVSENLQGYDVTDQYVDIEKRITILEDSINQIRAILKDAREVSDITNLTQQIMYMQQQIDSYRGQQEALEKNADLAKITIYLSTDEIALPYAPSETFRPEVIFKLAVRSLVSDLRGIAGKLIWIAVYGTIWIPVIGIIVLAVRYLQKKK